jgi:hypothetical protein
MRHPGVGLRSTLKPQLPPRQAVSFLSFFALLTPLAANASRLRPFRPASLRANPRLSAIVRVEQERNRLGGPAFRARPLASPQGAHYASVSAFHPDPVAATTARACPMPTPHLQRPEFRRIGPAELDPVLRRAADEQWRELALVGRGDTLLPESLLLQGWSFERIFVLANPLTEIPDRLLSLSALRALHSGDRRSS